MLLNLKLANQSLDTYLEFRVARHAICESVSCAVLASISLLEIDLAQNKSWEYVMMNPEKVGMP